MAEGDRNNHIAPEDLSAYADGEALAPQERERVERHLETCEVCRQELAELSAIQQLLSELPEPEVPRSFRLSPEDVETERHGPAPTPIQPWLLRHQATFRVAAMAAALLLALVVTIDLLPSGSGDDESADMETMDAPRQEAAQEEAAREDAAEPAPGAGSDEADDSASTAGDADMDTADDSVEEEGPAVQEDAAPPDDDDAAAPESDGSGAGESGGADQEAVDEAPEVAQEEDEEAPAAGDESAEPATETAEAPAVEDDSEGASDRDPSGAEDGFRLQEASEADDDTGMSTLRLVAIALAVLTVILAAVGFLVPRWWKSSSGT